MKDDQTVRWNGTTYRTILTPADSAGAMSIIYGEGDPMNGPPAHVHAAEDEVFIVLEGEVTFEVAGRRFTRGPLQTAFVPRGAAHSFRTGPAGARCLTVMTPGGFEGFFTAMAAGSFRLPQDMARVAEVAAQFGSRFVGPGLVTGG